jgi:T5SS/PEP-CTERM-associated repeat protein/autotransporter-associated beta strand protein
LTLGQAGNGTLNITSGGTVSIKNGVIGGFSMHGDGAATVGGGAGGSILTASGNLTVAGSNLGTLTILGGGSVSNANAYIATSCSCSHGSVTVDAGTGSATWTNTGDLFVGYDGVGILNITGGGSVSNVNGTIGDDESSNGTATVGGGAGISTWTNSGRLTVGSIVTVLGHGHGMLNINSGGLVSATALDGGNSDSSVKFDGGTLRITATDTASNTINFLSSGGSIDVPTSGSTFTITSAITGAGGLAKLGAGTLALSGANTINAGAIVNGGTLLVSNTTGSATGTGPVTVNNGALLAGAGIITGAVTINGGGTLAPGNSPGAISVGTLALNSTSVLDYQIDSGASLAEAADLVKANGDLTIDAGAILIIADLGSTPLATGTKFSLISYAGNWNGGTFGGYDDNSQFALGANTYQINYSDTQGGVNFGGGAFAHFVTLTAVLPGDFNEDNNVNAADYVNWRKAGGSASGYDSWRENFSTASGSGHSFDGTSFLSAAVPEPAAGILGFASTVILMLFTARSYHKAATVGRGRAR